MQLGISPAQQLASGPKPSNSKNEKKSEKAENQVNPSPAMGQQAISLAHWSVWVDWAQEGC